MTNKNSLLTFIFLMSGLLFAGIAGWLYYQQASLERRGLSAEGIVIGLVESIDSDDGTVSYAPVVRFPTQSGRQFEFQSNIYTNPPAYKIGETVTVLYPPENPAKAMLKGQNNLLIIILGILAGVEMLVGAIFGLKTISATLNGET